MTIITGVTTDLPGPPLARYYGTKWRLAEWIISHFPPHECYVEPFGGAAAVLLQRHPPASVEVYNDLDSQVVNFFRVLREHPEALVRAIELTPWSREEYELAFEPTDEPLEQARRFVLRAWQTRGGPSTRWRSGWRAQRTTRHAGKSYVLDWLDVPERLRAIVSRLRCVQIEHAPALEVIARYDGPETLFYVDPPYLKTTRSTWKSGGYRCEMTVEEHRELAEALHAIQGMALVSGYLTGEYQEWYADWQRVSTPARTQGKSALEYLWLSPQVQQRAIQRRLL